MNRISDYDYALPAELIAQTPLADRSASRMLVLNRESGAIQHRQFSAIGEFLRPEDLLVMNQTRVTARRLLGAKRSGGAVEVLILREQSPGLVLAMIKPAKRCPIGTILQLDNGVVGEVVGVEEGGLRLLRIRNGDWRIAGRIPLPPYITHHLGDEGRYQTVFAQQGGSAAAPTAGLHFTPTVLEDLQKRGVDTAFVTLDISLDTFRPVQVEALDDHEMHGETCHIPEETAAKINQCSGRVIAVGTTTVRTLESLAVCEGKVKAGHLHTKLFIRPGYRFQIVQGMVTNFHMPRSTLLVLMSAFAGRETMLGAYEEAIREKYRFFSFGDSMLVL